MTELSDTIHRSEVTVCWGPGCPYCARLRSDLQGIGLSVTEINIWDDPSAAGDVRSASKGNETVPTVVIGSAASVDPSAQAVVEAVQRIDPDQPVPARATAGLGVSDEVAWRNARR
jgi:mycoredoxin